MKEWVPWQFEGYAWGYGSHCIIWERGIWVVMRGEERLWTDPYMAGAARVAEALEQLAADGARITTA